MTRPAWTTDLLPAASEWPAHLQARATVALAAELDADAWERVRRTVLRAALVEARDAVARGHAATAARVVPMVESVIAWLDAGADLEAVPQGIAPHMAPAADAARNATFSPARRPDSVVKCIDLAMDQVDWARGDVGAAQLRVMETLLDAIGA